jgi:hypothetical protein
VLAVRNSIAKCTPRSVDHRRVEVAQQQLRLDVLADVRIAQELDALLLELRDAAADHFTLVEFHVRDAVHQQAARPVLALEYRHRVTGAIQLLRRGEPRGAGTDDGNLLAGAHRGRLGQHPALVPAAIDDLVLDVLDGDRRVVHAEHARAFAGRRADTAGELGEVVRHVQALECLAPQPAVDEVVPLRDHVVDRAARGHAADQLARVAERHAAIHAARALVAQPLLLEVRMELLPVADALERGAVDRQLPQVLDESRWLSHLLVPAP